MSNIQQAREALGTHLRALRRAAGVNGKEFAEQLGWTASKVSKLELGQQTPTTVDLVAWVEACGQPEAAEALAGELSALESFYQEYRRRLRSGMRFRQQEAFDTEAKAHLIRVFDTHYVTAFFQTAEYARHMLAKGARLHGAPDDVSEAVAVRLKRQELLYRPGKAFHLVITEAALRSEAAAPREVMTAQLDRLVAATTLGPNVRFGIIPFSVQWPVFLDHGFWIIDDDYVIVETLAAELRLTRPDEVATYARVFDQLAAIAVYGPAARALVTRVLLERDGESTEGEILP
ncbi:MAG: helix-turn-helix domain-containing protein [Actinobacteria bacterium]|nr:helix-turn-helix domain-containing protein [Actinomycetota bacterium]MBI3686285.1 helix-turn-helix domain-containing protein [Actinomycetota bacterium]